MHDVEPLFPEIADEARKSAQVAQRRDPALDRNCEEVRLQVFGSQRIGAALAATLTSNFSERAAICEQRNARIVTGKKLQSRCAA